MSQGIRLHVWGPRALFSRPEMKVERVSYDVITPSAARGIVEAIHWKPAIVWRIVRLRVLKPIRFESLRRNEVGAVASAGKAASAMRAGSTEGLALYVEEERQQRAATLLRDVAYVIEARLDLSPKGHATPEETVGKHLDMFRRRARKGQCFSRPCLGTREFAADFELLEGDTPEPDPSLLGERDLGWMVLDHHYPGLEARFFRARMRDGVIDVPALDGAEVAR
ncbi:type I-C CRISPR-associated protein Cas5c [Methylobacterium sp. Leaf466]|uniref:type I-C CRISPR-associated protein Cas5c n=1 Tax=Methylobacterium sp. Leaf466 TaxID=1736386 RepID=UPI0006F61E3E|nr:type I-C CRISPR-associated protein Cas5c [Methylobacterium sp. Leaf466]KQT85707.1 type I-C CRISPR-associated protein Cas5 [Methylobacterium sp. Leaf466]